MYRVERRRRGFLAWIKRLNWETVKEFKTHRSAVVYATFACWDGHYDFRITED